MIASMPPVSGDGSVSRIFVDPDDNLFAALDGLEARGVGFDQPLLHVTGFDSRDGAAHLLDALASSSFASALSASTLRLISAEPSKMSPNSSRSVS